MTGTPSFVTATSVSIVVTPISSARRNAASVFSGASPRAPRCPCRSNGRGCALDGTLPSNAASSRSATKPRSPAITSKASSVDDLLQRARLVFRRDPVERLGLDLRRHAGAAELLVALLADALGGGHRRLQVVARVELRRVFRHVAADRARHCEPDVGVDVHLAHAMAD